MSRVIAFADDEPDLRDAVAEFLRAAGYVVIEGGSGADLRQAVAGQWVDLALLDIMMPGEDGLSLAHWFKTQGPVGVIMATALGRPGDRIQGLDHGADDYVVKPYDLHELVARVGSVLRRWPGAAIEVQPETAGDDSAPTFILDAELRVAMGRGGQEVALSSAEFALLAYLADRRGRIVLREDLARAMGIDGDLRGVDVRVARARKKLMALPGAAEALRTVRGEGYLLAPH
jgi:DNA-binding response OmpR family regulator